MNGPKRKTLSAAMAGLLASHGAVPKEEQLTVAVGAHKGRVVIQMPQPVQVINLTPLQARTFGEALLKHADEAERLQAH